MAYAMKRRRNGGKDPKRRAAGVKTRKSKMFARGQRLAAKLVAGRKMRGTRKDIYDEIKLLVRQHGSQSDVDLLTGPAGVGLPSNDFREGLNSVATDLSGFKPSGSGRSKAAKAVRREFKRDKKDTKKEFESASAKAMRIRSERGVSLAEAWAIVKGESEPESKRKRKSRSKSKSSKRRSRARANPSRDFGAEFLFI